MAKKRCPTCGNAKKLSEFYKNRSQRDGLASQCKVCARASVKRHRQTEKGKASYRKALVNYARSAKGKAHSHKAGAKYRAKYPRAVKARRAVNVAIKAGRMPKASTKRCADCKKKAEQYHHSDYSKPLSVVALCRKCHRKRHGL